jgi:hypothetical protein
MMCTAAGRPEPAMHSPSIHKLVYDACKHGTQFLWAEALFFCFTVCSTSTKQAVCWPAGVPSPSSSAHRLSRCLHAGMRCPSRLSYLRSLCICAFASHSCRQAFWSDQDTSCSCIQHVTYLQTSVCFHKPFYFSSHMPLARAFCTI